ncbi:MULTISPECIES: hypothetical protein [unclassified Nitratiruptor]|uniref:hypothetical protein n=1 Tax=unclassified Nitratiruptor TaxID=2624044 RepID=UPI001915B82D|nr:MULTISPECIES: hypothetical protein [unclassified Nitratiruptor]BCD59629.1 hypothetical protein NitYY0810_C0380 [Nitratiruptor sp. YY08-10]BCD63553.1 hypothetical protein NitYY0814_C0380 [Nitratiruptor sp. YY08-14]BCD83105.1 hypothetical protein NrS2_55 [Nitratiruptor phage NrS-2]BCD83171.1 hypothetical protein NrS3_55 [Nitratiruptor phage NrS-3]
MKRVIDFSGQYQASADEVVVRANIKFFKKEDLRGFDKIVASEKDKEIFTGVENLELIGSKKSRRGAK